MSVLLKWVRLFLCKSSWRSCQQGFFVFVFVFVWFSFIHSSSQHPLCLPVGTPVIWTLCFSFLLHTGCKHYWSCLGVWCTIHRLVAESVKGHSNSHRPIYKKKKSPHYLGLEDDSVGKALVAQPGWPELRSLGPVQKLNSIVPGSIMPGLLQPDGKEIQETHSLKLVGQHLQWQLVSGKEEGEDWHQGCLLTST